MSFRKFSSSGEDLPSSKCGARTPLRSVENEVLHLSAPSSRSKSKSLLSADAQPTKLQFQSHPSTPVKHPTTEMTNTDSACGIEDITFKSFTCPGGEIEITGSLVRAEESIVLPKDQTMTNTCETEDTVISDSMIAQLCSEHIEHPYHNPEVKDASLLETARVCTISDTPEDSGDVDDNCSTEDFRVFQHDICGEKDVTWKSFVCDGGEVEVSDVTRLQNETIPLPKAHLGASLQEMCVSFANLSDCVQLCQVEHADHPYCSGEDGVPVITTFSENTNGSEKPAEELCDVTFKTLNCTGGEIQISDGTKTPDETVPLPVDQTVTCSESCNYTIQPSMLASDQDGEDHLDHLYCNTDNPPSTPSGHLTVTQEAVPFSPYAVAEVKQISLLFPDNRGSSICPRSEAEESDVQAVTCHPLDENSSPTSVTQDQIQEDHQQPNSYVDKNEAVVDSDPPSISTSSLINTPLKSSDGNSVSCPMHETPKKDSVHPEDSALPSALHKSESADSSHVVALAKTPAPAEVNVDHSSQVAVSRGPPESSEAKDSALGSSRNGQFLCDSAEKLRAENLPDVLRVLTEASALQLGSLSPAVRRASQFVLKSCKNSAMDRFLADDSALDGENSMVTPAKVDPSGLWAENFESPMPRPLFNSTTLGCRAQPGPVLEPVEDVEAEPRAVPQPKVENPAVDVPLIPDGPLQQQLRQMAEFLFLASGKMGPAAVSAPLQPPTAVTVPSTRATAAESHSVCVGTTPVKWEDHSANTSGVFERKRVFSVADSCTLTDPLLWNVPPGSLECLPKQELEQRLRSSMIMVEALVQQLAAARTHGCPSAGPAPSDLREKLVQTDHTELSQTTMHRELYLEALSRIAELELDQSSLQNLIQCMQDMRVSMTSLSCDTDAALSNMKQIGDTVREDHQSLLSQYAQMKSLLEKTKAMQTVMLQKVKDALHQRDEMRIQMEEAFTTREAAFSAVEHLRTHCASEISGLERIVGSQQELLAALHQTYPEQVALNQAYNETLNSASDVLSQTREEQSRLMEELCTVRGLLRKTAPMLLKLNEKAAAALRERDEQISAREQAAEEREQIEEDWNQMNLNLQIAREQIGDLNLQVTMLTSEIGVLRQKLVEREDEKGQLETKVTALSATVSSTLASYTFLEQSLSAETAKLQQSWKDAQTAKEKADELEASLGQSEQRVGELSKALAQSEEQLRQLQALSQSQSAEIQQLQDVCTQLSSVREMNEFLQMENELAREQMSESERMLRANLQGLRERNIQCEDLKEELGQLHLNNKRLQEDLETTRSRASVTQLELQEKLAQAVTEITLLHHRLRGLTNELHAALSDQKPDKMKDKEYHEGHSVERRHPSSSFVDSVMVALTTEKEEDVTTETPPGPDTLEPQGETEQLFSETSAFTRIAAITPKKNAAECEAEEDEQSCVAELCADLGSTVTELINTLKLVRQRKEAQLQELQNTICGLQVEQQATNNRYEAEVLELKHQLSSLNTLVERGSQALQQKAYDEKTVTMLTSEIQQIQEMLNKHKTENNELRKEVGELRRSLQQSKVESDFLRGELRKAGGQSAAPAHFMEEKIHLLKEVDRLKLALQEVEQTRVKLLERAKRHQIIHQTNQQKSERELQLLNNMINKVRETLLSLPEIVRRSEQLQQLVEFIG